MVLGLLVFVVLACTGREAKRSTEPPDIILITVDTLRADALGFTGNKDVATPFLDRLAGESAVFSNAHAHNVVTFPSHVNILTGLYPYQHGCRDNAGYVLDAKYQTLAPLLKQQGYATGAFIGAFPLDARYGLTPGFDVYDDKYPEGSGKLDFKIAERRADDVLSAAVNWWNAQTVKRFLWIHLYDPHAPYLPPPDFAAKYQSNFYLGEVAYVDWALQRHLEPLLNSARPTMLIFTSDHGEALGDHGELTHGLFAYESTLKVPLFIHERGTVKPTLDDRPARHIDIVPTVLKRVGAAVPPDRLGVSLLDESLKPQPTYFEALSASFNRGWAPLVGLIDEGHKYIDLPIAELYDLEADPGEKQNLLNERRRVVTQIRKTLAAAAPKADPSDRNVTQEQTAQLLALGYVSGAAAKKDYTEKDDPKNLVDIDNLLHRMIEFYQLGQQERAVEIAREMVRRAPDMPVGQEMLAFMLHQSERTDAAIATLRESIRKGQATDAMKIRLGLMLSETGRAKEAVEILEPYARRDDVDLLNAYGIALADLGRAPDAVRQFERVLKIDATNATAYQNLGIVALRSRQPQAALGHLSRALALNPELPLALNTLGVIHAQNGRPAEAIEVWSRAIVADPQLYDAMFNLAVVAGRSQRWDVAESALNRFITTAPPQRYARDIAMAREMLREVERKKKVRS